MVTALKQLTPAPIALRLDIRSLVSSLSGVWLGGNRKELEGEKDLITF